MNSWFRPEIRFATRALALVGLSFLGVASCTADLRESCEDGACTSGAGGASGEQPFTCDGIDTKEFPCDVFSVLNNNCQGCHSNPPQNGAPFPLVSYDDTQKPYFGDTPIWQAMARAVEPGPNGKPFMPLNAERPLPTRELNALRSWFSECQDQGCPRAKNSSTSSGM